MKIGCALVALLAVTGVEAREPGEKPNIIFILLDGFDISFGIDTGWIDLLKSLLITVYVAYFGSRGAEKFKSIGK